MASFRIRTTFILASIWLVLSAPKAAFAQDWGNTLYKPNGETDGVATIYSIVPMFQRVLSSVMAFVGVTLFVMLIVGGFGFLFSGGNPKQLEKARGTIVSALVGLVFIVSSYLILRIIQAFTGVDVTTFNPFKNM